MSKSLLPLDFLLVKYQFPLFKKTSVVVGRLFRRPPVPVPHRKVCVCVSRLGDPVWNILDP